MPLAALIALSCLATAPQQDFKEEVTVKGMRFYARCWRTPTGDTPYMIWNIGSLDNPPAGETWVIVGESVAFEGLPLQPVGGFRTGVIKTDPEKVAGAMTQQAKGEGAKVAIILGRVEKVAMQVEDLPIGDVELVKASHRPKGDFGAIFHLRIDKPMKLSTPSGIRIEIPKQGAETTISYAAMSPAPIAALTFKPGFQPLEDKLPDSALWKRLGGPIEIEAHLRGIAEPYGFGLVGNNYVAEAKGFDIKPGLIKGVSVEVVQSVVLQSFPIEFRVPVRDSK